MDVPNDVHTTRSLTDGRIKQNLRAATEKAAVDRYNVPATITRPTICRAAEPYVSLASSRCLLLGEVLCDKNLALFELSQAGFKIQCAATTVAVVLLLVQLLRRYSVL